MNFKKCLRMTLLVLAFASEVIFLTPPSLAESSFVALPRIENSTVAPRIIYLENPRFPAIAPDEIHKVVFAAANLVKDHFGIKIEIPNRVPVRDIDAVFADLVGNEPPGFKDLVGDFRNDNVNWEIVRENLAEQIEKQKDPLSQQIEFARPYLISPMGKEDVASFSRVVMETFRERLSHWTIAKLKDGHPVIGKVPGRPDLPFNEYGYWTLMARQGIEAEIVLTNQLVASVEYFAVPIHTSIRGGITGGSTEFNPSSQFGASVWVSLFPYISDDPHILKYRNGDTYTRDEALSYAGAMLAHEIGHQLLHLGHPWSNEACVMRPAEMLDFAPWVNRFDAEKCRIGSSRAMRTETIKIPIW